MRALTASILIIDDSVPDREWCHIILARTERFAHIYAAATAVEALSLFEDPKAAKALHGDHFPPTIILLDVNMPAMDGFEFLDELTALIHRGHLATAPAVALIEGTTGSDRERAARYPMITEFVTAMKHDLGLNKILGTIHTYPTLSEANKLAAGEWKRNHAPRTILRWLEKYHRWMRG